MIDFQRVDRKALQVAQTGIPRPEIIERKPYSHVLEFLKHQPCRRGILHEKRFGDLELEMARGEARFREDETHAGDETLRTQFHRGNIDSNAHRRQALELPSLGLAACFAQRPIADGHNQAGLLRNGDEPRRLDQAALWMTPADERLDPGNRMRPQIYLWLIMQHEFALLERVPQITFETL